MGFMTGQQYQCQDCENISAIILEFDDEVIKNFYQYNINKNGIEKNKVSLLFKEFKI